MKAVAHQKPLPIAAASSDAQSLPNVDLPEHKVDKLPVDRSASPALVGFFLWQNTLGKATLNVVAGPRQQQTP